MAKYLIKLTPLEPYFFGGERTSGFGKNTKQKQPYYIVSEKVPSQPTLFGTLRYLVLAQNNALINQVNSDNAENLVGKESFSFDRAIRYTNFEPKIKNAAEQCSSVWEFQKAQTMIKAEYERLQQAFGVINKISPLFLIKDDVWYVRTPFNHNPGDKYALKQTYTPFTMGNIPGADKIYPIDYRSKNGYGGGYVSLDDKLEIISDDNIFSSVVRMGIDSHRTDKDYDDKSSFFKKERKFLKKGFSFAFIAEVSDSFCEETTMVFMGQDKSPFRCEIIETSEDLVEKVKGVFNGKNACNIKYALSDVMCLEEKFPSDDKFGYYIADTRVIRNLESNMKAKSYYAQLKKSDKLYRIINAGSVFYTDVENLNSKALEVIGMNIFAQI
jgi:CRISPR-associated protein Cmr3